MQTTNTPENSPQPLLPFAEAELLRVRVRPADFARMLQVDKSTVSRWIKRNVIALGADGRLNPEQAMRQLLRNADPGQTRARLVRRAFGDLGDLRARAAQAADLEVQLRELRQRHQDALDEAAFDYDQATGWLDEFERQVAAIPQHERADLDGLAWRGRLRDMLIRIMDTGADLAEIDREIAASLDSALASIGGGAGA